MARYGRKSYSLLISWLANENKKTREQAAIALDQLGWRPPMMDLGHITGWQEMSMNVAQKSVIERLLNARIQQPI